MASLKVQPKCALTEAAQKGDLKKVEKLLEKGYEIDRKNENG